MKVSNEQIFRDDDTEGFDIRLKAADLTEDATPPAEVIIEMPSGENITFDLCGKVVGSCDRFLYWSYWNDAMDEAINLQAY